MSTETRSTRPVTRHYDETHMPFLVSSAQFTYETHATNIALNMSALAPMVINSLLGNQMSSALKPDLIPAVAEKAAGSSKIVRKHYSDGGYHPHEEYHPHEGGYENSGHKYVHHYKEGGYGKKKSRSVALTALTLLAFLFFLHILQSCLDQQMYDTTTTTAAPQILVLQAKLKAARESMDKLAKEAQKTAEGASQAQKLRGEAQAKAGGDQKRMGEAERRADELPEVVTEIVRWTTRATTKRHISPSMFTEMTDLYRYQKVPVKMKLIENYRRP